MVKKLIAPDRSTLAASTPHDYMTVHSALNLKRKLSFLDREKEKETGLETYNEDGQKPIHF